MTTRFLNLFLSLVLIAFSADTVCACTIFVARRNGKVLVGNNEDWPEPSTMMRFIPPEKGRYGMVFFAYAKVMNFHGIPVPAGHPQGGMNDQGLFFDYAALEKSSQILLADRNGNSIVIEPPETTPEKPKIPNPEESRKSIEDVMSQCATVDDVLKLAQKGEASFKVVRPKADYQVLTNFRQSSTAPENITCPRFKKANKALGEKKDISVESFRAILKATHQEGKWPTQYSNIYDLKTCDVYIYYQHNFEKVVRLNLNEELKKGKRDVRLADLFK